MTGPLKNERHEAFAHGLAKGMTQIEAYVAAGYKPDDGAAARLSGNVRISERVAELLARAARRTEISVASVTETLLRIAKKGEEIGEAPGLSVARAAVMDAAKINGLVVDTVETVRRTPEQRRERIAALKAELNEIPRVH